MSESPDIPALIAEAEEFVQSENWESDYERDGGNTVGTELIARLAAALVAAYPSTQSESVDVARKVEELYPYNGTDPSIITALRSAFRAGAEFAPADYAAADREPDATGIAGVASWLLAGAPFDDELYDGYDAQLTEAGKVISNFVAALLSSRPVPSVEKKVREFVEDLADHGTRFDLNPTVNTSHGPVVYVDYIERIDKSIRERAAAVRALLTGDDK